MWRNSQLNRKYTHSYRVRGHSGEIDREAVRGRQNKIDEKPAVHTGTVSKPLWDQYLIRLTRFFGVRWRNLPLEHDCEQKSIPEPFIELFGSISSLEVNQGYVLRYMSKVKCSWTNPRSSGVGYTISACRDDVDRPSTTEAHHVAKPNGQVTDKTSRSGISHLTFYGPIGLVHISTNLFSMRPNEPAALVVKSWTHPLILTVYQQFWDPLTKRNQQTCKKKTNIRFQHAIKVTCYEVSD